MEKLIARIPEIAADLLMRIIMTYVIIVNRIFNRKLHPIYLLK